MHKFKTSSFIAIFIWYKKSERVAFRNKENNIFVDNCRTKSLDEFWIWQLWYILNIFPLYWDYVLKFIERDWMKNKENVS